MSGTFASCTPPPPAAAAGAGDDAGASAFAAGAGAAFAATGAGAAASPLSISATTCPSAISSPSLTLISLTTPATEEGTSIVALSDSRVIRPWSFVTVSPGLTRISITGTLV